MPFLPYEQVTHLDASYILTRLRQFIEEDIPTSDITSEFFYSDTQISTAYLENEEEIVFAGKQIIEQLPKLSEAETTIEFFCNDGDKIPPLTKIFQITAPTRFLLAIERTILNLLQRLCGVATNTKLFVEIAEPYGVRILDTRKTTPGLRLFEKYAVRCGGGWNHRLNLSEGILIKDNHIVAAGSLTKAVDKVRQRHFARFLEVEVENPSQLLEALVLNVDGILLDNFTPGDIAKFVPTIRERKPHIFIEASGGITLETIGDYVKTGVDAVSVGALTHSARSVKMHLEFIS
jgi:nicotinate-nucleotide pyrophosphorylase (carboxylating)